MKVNYGIDAPGIMRAFGIIAPVSLLAGALMPILSSHPFVYLVAMPAAFLIGIVTGVLFFAMFAYTVAGKFRQRDYMLSRVQWTGMENVLDVGTGRGLLMIGAARHLKTGKATGIDIWRQRDLSNNGAAAAVRNAELEGVSARVEVKEGDARILRFPNGSFDVVLSLLCVHNIDGKGEKAAACREMARVLKPGGKLLLADYLPTGAYAKVLTQAGLKVHYSKPHFTTALSLMWMVEATKPAA